tara:strand:+ start:365 stop:907 length:543 start_codon:yes stop_codon:yes gene_type:complete
MLEVLKSLRPKKAHDKAAIIKRFMAHPEHQWFANDPTLSRLMAIFCDSWTKDVYDYFAAGNEVLIIAGQGHLACAMSSVKQTNIILAFPDLVQILKSASPMRGVAILAHELGHLINNHSTRKISAIEAQIEADQLAFDMGFGRDLEQVLLEYEHSLDCRVRVARLTQLYYSNLKDQPRLG